MIQKILFILAALSICLGSGFIGWWAAQSTFGEDSDFLSPILKLEKPKPLQAYSITALSQRQYQKSPLTVEKVLTQTPDYTSYLFSYTSLNKKVTGQLNVPTKLPESPVPTIVMLRGYVPPETYSTGVGTKNAAKVLAENGFVTVAPDFLGYGDSDPEPTDSWQARFEKPILVIELIKSLEKAKLKIDPTDLPQSTLATKITAPTQEFMFGPLGLWGHSNGGQIALTTLEVLQQPIPTTLWAPVTAPFPYSILFFSDENEDEGKAMRKWLAMFEENYDVFDFSLTKHLDRLRGPIQLHHGTDDEAALLTWSNEFESRIKLENERREEAATDLATGSATLSVPEELQPLDLTFFTYPGADHNLQPGWNTVVERDVAFFKRELSL